jgi:hypothetical protein
MLELEKRNGATGVYIIYSDCHGVIGVCASKQAGRDWLLSTGEAEDMEDLLENYHFEWQEIIY